MKILPLLLILAGCQTVEFPLNARIIPMSDAPAALCYYAQNSLSVCAPFTWLAEPRPCVESVSTLNCSPPAPQAPKLGA